MKKLTLVLMAVVIGVFLTVPAFASGPGEGRCPGNEGGPGHHRDAMFAKLKLSDAQKAKIEALQTAVEKEVKPIKEKLFDKSVELRRLWLQAAPDKDKITAAQKEVRKLRDLIDDKVTAMRLEIHKVLTPEQNEKMANSHWGKDMGHGPRGCTRGHGEHEPDPGMGIRQ